VDEKRRRGRGRETAKKVRNIYYEGGELVHLGDHEDLPRGRLAQPQDRETSAREGEGSMGGHARPQSTALLGDPHPPKKKKKKKKPQPTHTTPEQGFDPVITKGRFKGQRHALIPWGEKLHCMSEGHGRKERGLDFSRCTAVPIRLENVGKGGGGGGGNKNCLLEEDRGSRGDKPGWRNSERGEDKQQKRAKRPQLGPSESPPPAQKKKAW